jgi:hypothetical protein
MLRSRAPACACGSSRMQQSMARQTRVRDCRASRVRTRADAAPCPQFSRTTGSVSVAALSLCTR